MSSVSDSGRENLESNSEAFKALQQVLSNPDLNFGPIFKKLESIDSDDERRTVISAMGVEALRHQSESLSAEKIIERFTSVVNRVISSFVEKKLLVINELMRTIIIQKANKVEGENNRLEALQEASEVVLASDKLISEIQAKIRGL